MTEKRFNLNTSAGAETPVESKIGLLFNLADLASV